MESKRGQLVVLAAVIVMTSSLFIAIYATSIVTGGSELRVHRSVQNMNKYNVEFNVLMEYRETRRNLILELSGNDMEQELGSALSSIYPNTRAELRSGSLLASNENEKIGNEKTVKRPVVLPSGEIKTVKLVVY